MKLSFSEWNDRIQKAGARLQNARRLGDFQVYPNVADGCPESPFPLDGNYHSVTMLMEPTNDLGIPTKAVLMVGHGTPVTNPYRLSITTYPVDIIRFKDEETGEIIEQMVVYMAPDTDPGKSEIRIPEPKPITPPSPADERTKIESFLRRVGVPVPKGASLNTLRNIAQAYGYVG